MGISNKNFDAYFSRGNGGGNGNGVIGGHQRFENESTTENGGEEAHEGDSSSVILAVKQQQPKHQFNGNDGVSGGANGNGGGALSWHLLTVGSFLNNLKGSRSARLVLVVGVVALLFALVFGGLIVGLVRVSNQAKMLSKTLNETKESSEILLAECTEERDLYVRLHNSTAMTMMALDRFHSLNLKMVVQSCNEEKRAREQALTLKREQFLKALRRALPAFVANLSASMDRFKKELEENLDLKLRAQPQPTSTTTTPATTTKTTTTASNTMLGASNRIPQPSPHFLSGVNYKNNNEKRSSPITWAGELVAGEHHLLSDKNSGVNGSSDDDSSKKKNPSSDGNSSNKTPAEDEWSAQQLNPLELTMHKELGDARKWLGPPLQTASSPQNVTIRMLLNGSAASDTANSTASSSSASEVEDPELLRSWEFLRALNCSALARVLVVADQLWAAKEVLSRADALAVLNGGSEYWNLPAEERPQSVRHHLRVGIHFSASKSQVLVAYATYRVKAFALAYSYGSVARHSDALLAGMFDVASKPFPDRFGGDHLAGLLRAPGCPWTSAKEPQPKAEAEFDELIAALAGLQWPGRPSHCLPHQHKF